jgi:hypothetical protein
MDYSKSGNAKFGKGIPRHLEKGTKDADDKSRAAKDQLLARMKAAALAKAVKKAD